MATAGFIAIPYPEELLYSVIARTKTMALYDSPASLGVTFFGRRNVPATIDLPGHIGFFSQSVGEILPFTSQDIVNKLTLWPYYSRFVKRANRDQVFQLILGERADEIHVRAGLNQSSFANRQNLMYCPLCIEDDRKSYGLRYWHRVHQIPEILLCPKHEAHLVPYVPKAQEEARGYFIDANTISLPTTEVRISKSKPAIELAQFAEAILLNKSTFDVAEVNYFEPLQKIYGRGKQLDSRQLAFDFQVKFGRDLMEIQSVQDSQWISNIARRPGHYFHPIRHLLISRFIDSLDHRKTAQTNLFGNGPWKCLNPTTDHFGSLVVTEIRLHTDTKSRRQIAVLKCECGMVYSMSFKNNDTNSTRYVRILEWGHTWHERLALELKSGKSLRAIAKALGTDAKTIAKYKEGPSEKEAFQPDQDLRMCYRKNWQKLLTQFEFNRVSQARKSNPALFAWLHRNDYGWLKLVNNNAANHGSLTSDLRLDWGLLDEKIIVLIGETIDRLKREGYRGRITKSLVTKIIKCQHFLLGKNANKLPKSVALLTSRVESREDFTWRRVENAIASVAAEGVVVKWKVMRKAGLRKTSWSSLIESRFNEKLYG